jgi:hypothetical protein
MILSAAALASAAGFFSVYGLTQIYAAAAVSVIIMGTALEFAKLVVASFLHRYWNKIGIFLKFYMIVAVASLMLITSIGVFGYLTAAYQQDNIPLTEISQRLESDKTELQRNIDRKSQIDQQIAKLPNSYVKQRKQLMQSFAAEYNSLQPSIDRLTKEINELQTRQVSVEAKIGPIVYVASALNQDPKQAIIDLTLLIVCVFDPLAVAMVIGINIALEERRKAKQESKIIEMFNHPVEVDEPVDSHEESHDEDVDPPVEPEVEEDYGVILPTEPEVTSTPLLSKKDVLVERLRKSIADEGSV